jgi:hypothetical protein
MHATVGFKLAAIRLLAPPQVAEAAGVGRQLMKVADAKAAIQKLVDDFKVKAAASSPEQVSTPAALCTSTQVAKKVEHRISPISTRRVEIEPAGYITTPSGRLTFVRLDYDSWRRGRGKMYDGEPTARWCYIFSHCYPRIQLFISAVSLRCRQMVAVTVVV